MSKYFDDWCADNKELLETNKIPTNVAEIIYESARTSVIMNLLTMIQNGEIKVDI